MNNNLIIHKIYKSKLQINIGGSLLSWENGTLGRNLIMFPKIKAILEEYVGSMFRIQKWIVSHKSKHSIARSVNSCKWEIMRNSCLNNNKLVFKGLKFLLRVNFILDRSTFRTLWWITESDTLLNSKPSCRQPLRKETLSAKPGRVLNNHLTISSYCLGFSEISTDFFSEYMAVGIFINFVSTCFTREVWKRKFRFSSCQC